MGSLKFALLCNKQENETAVMSMWRSVKALDTQGAEAQADNAFRMEIISMKGFVNLRTVL